MFFFSSSEPPGRMSSFTSRQPELRLCRRIFFYLRIDDDITRIFACFHKKLTKLQQKNKKNNTLRRRCRTTSEDSVLGPVVVSGLSGPLLQGCIRKPSFDALAALLLKTDEPERSDQDGTVVFLCAAQERNSTETTLFSRGWKIPCSCSGLQLSGRS